MNLKVSSSVSGGYSYISVSNPSSTGLDLECGRKHPPAGQARPAHAGFLPNPSRVYPRRGHRSELAAGTSGAGMGRLSPDGWRSRQYDAVDG